VFCVYYNGFITVILLPIRFSDSSVSSTVIRNSTREIGARYTCSRLRKLATRNHG